MDYLTLKLIHIIGAIIFVGNITVTALWKVMADRTRDPKTVAFGQRLVIITDFAFTGTGAVAVLITGLLMAMNFADTFWTIHWVLWGLILFSISGMIWMAILIPVQIKQARLAKQFDHTKEIPEQYWRLGRIWAAFGTISTVLPFVNLYFMVFKPG